MRTGCLWGKCGKGEPTDKQKEKKRKRVEDQIILNEFTTKRFSFNINQEMMNSTIFFYLDDEKEDKEDETTSKSFINTNLDRTHQPYLKYTICVLCAFSIAAKERIYCAKLLTNTTFAPLSEPE